MSIALMSNRWAHGPNLKHYPKQIRQPGLLHNLSICESIDVHSSCLNFLSGGRNPKEFAFVSSTQGELRCNYISLDDYIVKSPLDIWKGGAHHAKNLHVSR
jgi:hypothetical protein